MKKIVAFPQSNNHLLHINSVSDLNESDYECIREIEKVLIAHNKTERFSLQLLHKHFELQEGEVCLEQTNEKQRTQTVQVIQESDIPDDVDSIETEWYFGNNPSSTRCARKCVKFSGGAHYDEHVFGNK
ncbi:hypothetical protein [Pseudoalteromonas luteoviolacea]|uniref:Uncharacterized protein n=1 Tax=Pseudoalteromonas luteoviolacea S4054 TaxID=1129367 RepID=A0A0F6AD82_9GAMM|nr:hypothetical protein [Pseudoalteromonas luteoviolacea]AOT06841.1 hypothetical protein S4054249_02655 [Pseudoalteromonas luteoviolacea]AOT11759.1 hypothetical protein S40542_02655 [Pseudoalteromonas luteoviolacea]AOT16671.1 hypothetical protein S4054_02655 [Pseudoalteromonas luteoviolacea]KKE83334.1 hypothetical protein N479_14420 [Pseudoalteromonas luteoviolacea S4054]KZN74049.1 hypothetical protein N481_10065 [Pseudoalteromonas luteoviolacea S4047-1]